jgi:hypothetical protein
VTSSLPAHEHPLTVLDAGDGGLWTAAALGDGRVRIEPTTAEAVFAALAARLGAQAASSR